MANKITIYLEPHAFTQHILMVSGILLGAEKKKEKLNGTNSFHLSVPNAQIKSADKNEFTSFPLNIYFCRITDKLNENYFFDIYTDLGSRGEKVLTLPHSALSMALALKLGEIFGGKIFLNEMGEMEEIKHFTDPQITPALLEDNDEAYDKRFDIIDQFSTIRAHDILAANELLNSMDNEDFLQRSLDKFSNFYKEELEKKIPAKNLSNKKGPKI